MERMNKMNEDVELLRTGEISPEEFKDRLFFEFKESNVNAIRLIKVLIEEIGSVSYREGYATGAQGSEYDFKKFITKHSLTIEEAIEDIMKGIFEID